MSRHLLTEKLKGLEHGLVGMRKSEMNKLLGRDERHQSNFHRRLRSEIQYVLIPRTMDPKQSLSQVCSVNTLIEKLTKPTFFHQMGVRRLQSIIDFEQILGHELEINPQVLNMEADDLTGTVHLTRNKEK